MKKIFFKLFLIAIIFCVQALFSQDLSKVSMIKVDDLSDKQVERFWNKAKEQGRSWQEVEQVLRAKGMSATEVYKLKERIRDMKPEERERNDKDVGEERLDEDRVLLFGLTGKEKGRNKEKDSLFGYDFFNNPNISFIPNVNVATPQSYRLGPGDVIEIDVWGAAETSYKKKINREGNIQISGVGNINLNGLPLDKAILKVKSYLGRIYSGIKASRNSYNKVYINVSLSKVRTVQVNIVGEVKTPGTYSLSALSSVLNALYAAGGPTKIGTFRRISLVRNSQRVADFDIYKYLLSGDEKGNLQLRDQDVIIVGSYNNLVTVVGEVKRPGIYELIEGETVEDLLKYCGGFKAEAFKDQIVIERFNGRGKEIKELPLNKVSVVTMKAGDKIKINEVVDKFLNKVSVKGAVYQPGDYQYYEGMTVLDLLKKSSGVLPEAFLSRALITRFYNETDKEIVAFSLSEVYEGESNVALRANDEVYIYKKSELREEQFVNVNGAVNKPQKVEFAQGMQVEDVIALSGGLKEGADPSNIEISRRLKDGSFEVVGEVFLVSSGYDLVSGQKERKVVLKPYDIVSVRYLKGYTPQKNVIVKGEVKYPGEYSITTKNERISDLILRAGGLSPYAYLEGATLIRKKVGEIEEKQTEFLKEIKIKDVKDKELSESGEEKEKKEEVEEIIKEDKKEFRIGIDLKKILSNKKSIADLILKEGDELLIPSEKQTVEVQGEVYSPSLVRYVPGKSLSYYIEKAGGFSQQAKKSKSYVVYSNGSVDATTSFLFFKDFPKIKPGATIFVPKKEKKRKITAQELIGITTGIATLGVLINTLTK